MTDIQWTTEQMQYHKIWANAFKSVELAFKDGDIRENLKDVIKLQIDASPFEDIQIYKYNKNNGNLEACVMLDESKPLLHSFKYDSVPDTPIEIVDDGIHHVASINKFTNNYNNYVMVLENKKSLTTTSELYCEEVIRRAWVLIMDKLGYQDKIREASITDSLTKVGNRSYYSEVTHNLFNDGKQELTFSLIDLFRLKYINDQFGHKYGDKYIKTSAKLIKNELDSDDTMFRIGGDEFVVISGKLKKTKMLDKFNNVNLKLCKVDFGLNIPFPLNINYGVYEGEEKLDTFYSKADNRLARQKTKTYKRLNIDRRK